MPLQSITVSAVVAAPESNDTMRPSSTTTVSALQRGIVEHAGEYLADVVQYELHCWSPGVVALEPGVAPPGGCSEVGPARGWP